VRRILERAPWGAQMRPAFDPVTGLPRAKGKKMPIHGAMVTGLVARLQRIVETGDDGTVPRLAQLIHEIMQPRKGEGSGERPQRVVFADVPSGLDQAKPVPDPPGAGAPNGRRPRGQRVRAAVNGYKRWPRVGGAIPVAFTEEK